jgi:hypothetical protein
MTDDEDIVDNLDLAVEVDNALNPNALNPNALNPNALNPNALSLSALNPIALSSQVYSALQLTDMGGAMSRKLLEYTVSCAFDPAQVFNFSWTDGAGVVHQESYRGLLGLAPGWATAPLDAQGQTMVSACLASRSNWYGVTVTISSRSAIEPLHSNTSASELQLYSHIEGAFWGNLFAPVPYLRACYRQSNVEHSRAAFRDCAAGHVNSDGTISHCGMIEIVGPCGQHCSFLNANGQYFPLCYGNTGTGFAVTSHVITTGLR